METVTGFKDTMIQSLTEMWLEISRIFPSIIGAIFILIIGVFVTKIIVKIIKKVLKLAKVSKLDEKINQIEIVEGKNLNFDTVKVISSFVKWIIYIMLVIMIADLMNLKIISQQIAELLSYLPKLFAALIIFMIGLLFANFVKKGLKSLFDSMDMSGGKIISQIVFFLILTFISITALNQAGVDTEIITNNVVMIIGAFLLAFAIAFGLGAREVVSKLLKTFYARKTFEVGQKIEFNDTVFEVENIENIFIVLKNDDEKLIVPIDDLIKNQIKVL